MKSHVLPFLREGLRPSVAGAARPRVELTVQLSAPGQPFHDPGADTALFAALRTHLRKDLPVVELDSAINDPAFARACADTLLRHLQAGTARSGG